MYCCWSIANSIFPSRTASSTSGERSKVASLILSSWLLLCRTWRAGVEPVGPSARTPSMLPAERMAPEIRFLASVVSARLTASTFTAPPVFLKAAVKPLQRRSSAALPASWFTHGELEAGRLAGATRGPAALVTAAAGGEQDEDDGEHRPQQAIPQHGYLP